MWNPLASRSSILGKYDDDKTAAVGDHDPLKRGSFDHNHLILRSERSERLEGWRQAQWSWTWFETHRCAMLLTMRIDEPAARYEAKTGNHRAALTG